MAQPRQTRSPGQQRLIIAVDRVIYHLARHWLAFLNTVGALLVALPLLAPYLAANGHERAAGWIYRAFHLLCHQKPDHSFFLFGHPLAYCQRDTAIYAGVLVLGLLYAVSRRRLPPAGLHGAALLSLPIAIDGLTQLAGLRQSTWELRVLTGTLFAAAVAWVAFPRLNNGFAEIETTLVTRFERLARAGRARPL